MAILTTRFRWQARFFPRRPENQTTRGGDRTEGSSQARRGVVEQFGFPFFNRTVVGFERGQVRIFRRKKSVR